MELYQASEAANYYGMLYKAKMRTEHPGISGSTIQQLADRRGQYGIEPEQPLEMIEHYFQTDFKGFCDHRIWHFLSKSVFVRIGLHTGAITTIYES